MDGGRQEWTALPTSEKFSILDALSVVPRSARAVAVGCARHLTQRGVDRLRIFFTVADRWVYLRTLRHCAEHARLCGCSPTASCRVIFTWSPLPTNRPLMAESFLLLPFRGRPPVDRPPLPARLVHSGSSRFAQQEFRCL